MKNLSEESGARILASLFGGLREELASDGGRYRLTERYGADACVRLWEILEALIGASQPAASPPSGNGTLRR